MRKGEYLNFRAPPIESLARPWILIHIYAGHVKVGQVLERLREDSWYLVATKGSHRQFKHPTKSGRVTVAGKPSDDLLPGTLNSIFEQAGWKK